MMLPLLGLALQSAQSNSLAPVISRFTRELASEAAAPKGRNVVFSPLSVHACLALLLPGMDQKDGRVLAKALGLPNSSPEGGISLYEAGHRELSEEAGRQLQMANSVWTAPHLHLTPAYQQAVHAAFQAEARSLPELGAAAAKEINDWVATKTENRITKLVGPLPQSTKVLLVNAISFDAQWQRPFNVAATQPRPFHTQGGAVEQPATMAANVSLSTYENDSYTGVEIPYRTGGFSMLVLLPKSDQDPMGLLKHLDVADFEHPTHHLVDLQLPKFKISTSMSLLSSLSRMGFRPVFSGFDGVGMLGRSQRLQVTGVDHAATIDVDEQGTRAAAATAVMVSSAMRREERLTFHADRPFAFVVWTQRSHLPLFTGVVYDPGK